MKAILVVDNTKEVKKLQKFIPASYDQIKIKHITKKDQKSTDNLIKVSEQLEDKLFNGFDIFLYTSNPIIIYSTTYCYGFHAGWHAKKSFLKSASEISTQTELGSVFLIIKNKNGTFSII